MGKAGEPFVKKFEGGERESWPLPPSSVFRCREASPWLNPNLFYNYSTECSRYRNGVAIVGEAILEDELEGSQFDAYDELEHHSLAANRLSNKMVEYSDNPERGIDPGLSGRRFHRKKGKSSSPSLLNPPVEEEEEGSEGTLKSNGSGSRLGIPDLRNEYRGSSDFDGDVLIKFKEVVNEYQESISSGGMDSTRGAKKSRRWSPFKKQSDQTPPQQSQSWKLFY